MPQTVYPGQVVADRFEILRFIAEGGMGEVYEARDRVLGESVALKFLSRRSVGDPRVARRFRREIQLARRVTHSNVCRIFDLYQHRPSSGLLEGETIAFVTMELLQGETLEEYLDRKGPLSEEEALPLVSQVSAALAAAHSVGVVHRDFKPNNVILVRDAESSVPRAVVTDFGLARSVSKTAASHTPLTGEMKVVGTADYMAPEQMRGESVGPAGDLFALGVVIYEMVTGHKPWSADSPVALLTKRLSEPPAPPRNHLPDLGRRWESVILRCLAEDPDERPSSALEVIAELRGEPVRSAADPSGVIAVPEELPRRSVVPALSGLAVFLVLLATTGWIVWHFRSESDSLSPADFNPSQLTSSERLDLDPTFSPDGDRLAYSSNRTGTFEIYLRDLSDPGGEDRRVSPDNDRHKLEPAWSPDGKAIAYHSLGPGRGGLRLIQLDGDDGKVTPVSLTPIGSRPAWSPDGEWIAFQTDSRPLLSENTPPALAPSTIRLIRADGTAERQLTREDEPPGGHGSPAWSPDGSCVVFSASERGRSEIWSVSVETGELLAIVRQSAEVPAAYDPAYAPDGRSLFFSAGLQEVHGLWRQKLSRDGRPRGEPEQVINPGLANLRHLAFAATGHRLAYVAISTRSNLWSLPVNAAGEPAGAPQALTRSTGRNTRPMFSPDGTRVAFERWSFGVNADVWVMNADGSEVRQVTRADGTNTQPSWFPGGRRLAFKSIRGDEPALRAIDLETGAEELLLHLPADADWLRLSPDGERVAYHARLRGRGINVWVRDLGSAGKVAHPLTFDEELMGFPSWSTDGRWLAFQIKRGEDSYVAVVPSTGGAYTQLTHGPGPHWHHGFSPDTTKVAFASRRDDHWNLYWVDRENREERRLTDLHDLDAYVRYPAWSPSGDRIVFERAETVGDIWQVEIP